MFREKEPWTQAAVCRDFGIPTSTFCEHVKAIKVLHASGGGHYCVPVFSGAPFGLSYPVELLLMVHITRKERLKESVSVQQVQDVARLLNRWLDGSSKFSGSMQWWNGFLKRKRLSTTSSGMVHLKTHRKAAAKAQDNINSWYFID